jgi:asparagine synthase (glutamine-hydrolysing)
MTSLLYEQVFLCICCKAIKKSGIKVVLSGEGAMKFCGYLYFANAFRLKIFRRKPSKESKLFTADLLRADKAMMAHGVETRVPF